MISLASVQPAAEPIQFHRGLNLIGTSIDSTEVANLADLARLLGLANGVDTVARFNRTTQGFEVCRLDDSGNALDAGCYAPAVGGEGWLVTRNDPASIPVDTERNCLSVSLLPGLNLVSLPCASQSLDAPMLLDALGADAGAASVQGFDRETGRWWSALRGGKSPGTDRRLERSGAYLVGVSAPVVLTPPIAEAGDNQTVFTGETALLDATASFDADGDSLSYSWTIAESPLGSEAILNGADTAHPTLTPVVAGSYLLRLSVTDSVFESLPDDLVLVARPLPAYRVAGLNFSPYIAPGEDPVLGTGQITEEELEQRLTRVAPFTRATRTFGCVGDLRPAARIARDLGQKVVASAWLDKDESTNQAEVDCLVEEAIAGHADIGVVGSEVLLRADLAEAELIAYVDQVRQRLRAAGVLIPVTTAEIGAVLLQHPAVLDSVDIVYANFYPHWGGQELGCAVSLLDSEFRDVDAAAEGKEVVVSETGWPSCGNVIGAAVPSPENAAQYFLEFVSWAESQGVEFFYFEAFDEPWKARFEGPQGACWGLWSGDDSLKLGMQAVFDGQELEHGAECAAFDEPVIDFASGPAVITTNLPTYLVAIHVQPGSAVLVNGVEVPTDAIDDDGNVPFSVPVAANGVTSINSEEIELRVIPPTGGVPGIVVKTVIYDPDFSTDATRVLYVDVVDVDGDLPSLNGTVVIDLDTDAVIGFLPGRHVRDISPQGRELYLNNRDVLDSASHRTVRVLPFSADLAANAYVVSRDGSRMYANDEIVDVASNVLLPERLPRSIATGSSWAGAAIPGGPTISADGHTLYCCNALVAIDLDTLQVTEGSRSGGFLSDIEVSADGLRVLTSAYAFSNGVLDVYDADDLTAPVGSVGGLGDFAGRVHVLGNGPRVVVGSAGNPQSRSDGRVSIVDLDSATILSALSIPLADDFAVEGDTVVYAASGGDLLVDRIGVRILIVTPSGKLVPSKTYYLGVNRFEPSLGKPSADRIRGILFKPRANAEP